MIAACSSGLLHFSVRALSPLVKFLKSSKSIYQPKVRGINKSKGHLWVKPKGDQYSNEQYLQQVNFQFDPGRTLRVI
jgi:hypothetical protein